MLCEACGLLLSVVKTHPQGKWNGTKPQVFGYPEDEKVWGGSHHIEPNTFLEAAMNNCYICSTLYRACTTESRRWAQSFRMFYHLSIVDGENSIPSVDSHYQLNISTEILAGKGPIPKRDRFDYFGKFKMLPQKEISATGEPLELTLNTFTSKCADQVRDWLGSCSQTHAQCNQDWRLAGGSPARLLKLLSGLEEVRLETFAKNVRRPRYVTLSHCWGAGMTVTLKESNLEDSLNHNTAIATLPKRFQDAFAIARWMQIEYIWIDALCIIQDSKEDWLLESAKMGDIYTNSYCNIAATSGDPRKGCFTDRLTAMVEPVAIPNPLLCDETATYVIGYDDFWSSSLLDTPLHTRGWILQERLLSPRTIHFGQEQMFWECRCLMACEAYPKGIPEQFRNNRTRSWRHADQMLDPGNSHKSRWKALKLVPELPFPKQKRGMANPEWIYKSWCRSVETYMDCKLSFGQDKLVAISGIAQRVARATRERYLAGLWENSMFVPSLLWYVLARSQGDDITPSLRSPPYGHPDYRAPSWSWASLEATIMWNCHDGCDRVIIDILKTHVVQAKGSRLGRVKSAELHVRGHAFKAELFVASEAPDGSLVEDGQYGLRLESVKQGGSDVNSTAHGSTIKPIVFLDTSLTPQRISMHVYLLPVCTGWRGLLGEESINLAGLVLVEAVSSGLAKRFARVGTFCMDPDETSRLYRTRYEDFEFAELNPKDAHSEVLVIV